MISHSVEISRNLHLRFFPDVQLFYGYIFLLTFFGMLATRIPKGRRLIHTRVRMPSWCVGYLLHESDCALSVGAILMLLSLVRSYA